VRGGFSVNCEDRPAESDELGVLKTGAVLNGWLDMSENKFVASGEQGRVRTPVKQGTIIFCRKNSEEVIGAAALATEDRPNIFLSDLLWELLPCDHVCRYWLLYTIQSNCVRQTIKRKSTGTQSSMKNISQDRLLSIPILIPPYSEQRKITEILRTWDEAIQIMDALRASKTEQLKAIGRLFFDPCHPHFLDRPHSWDDFDLGDVFRERIESGDGTDQLLSITMAEGVIDRNDVGRKDTSNDDKSQYKLILPGDIGYNTMRMWQGVSGLSALKGIVSPAYTVVVPDNQNIDARYAAHLFKSRRMIFDFERYSQGLTSDTRNLKFPAFSKIRVFLPPIELQRKQANLLDAMKSEIVILERQRMGIERQKRGLMQKLLTGEWRVKVKSEKEAAA
jgi:type I restriction enzyme, S subunit